VRTIIPETVPVSDAAALQAIHETGWARPEESGYLWHYYVAGWALCHRHLSWPHRAEESDSQPAGGCCVECCRRARSVAVAALSPPRSERRRDRLLR
jgi:hypothetical protein